jgi:hypothetical protein
MKRFAQIDNGVVTGILQSGDAPTVLPQGRIFVDVTDNPSVREFDRYDGATFTRMKTPAQFADPITRLIKKTGA